MPQQDKENLLFQAQKSVNLFSIIYFYLKIKELFS